MNILGFLLAAILFAAFGTAQAQFTREQLDRKTDSVFNVSDFSLSNPYFILKAGQRVDSTLARFFRGDFADAGQFFDDSLKIQSPPHILAKFQRDFLSKAGTIGAQLDEELRVTDGFLWFVKTFETTRPIAKSSKMLKGRWEFQIAVTPDSLIDGFFIRELKEPKKIPEYRFPDYVRTDSVREFKADFGKGIWKVSGSINLPMIYNVKYPAIVLLHDAGPLDRDGSYSACKPFRDLGWALAARGFAVLRYDKRTYAHKRQIDSLGVRITPKQEIIDDALEALKYLRSRPDIQTDKIVLLGLGLGGMLAPKIAALDTSVAGIIVMNSPARPLEDALLSHVKYVLSLDTIDQEKSKRQIKTLERQTQNAKSPALTIATPDSMLPLGTPASYWLELRGYNASKSAAALKKPFLVLHCKRSYQIEDDDFLLWQSGLNSSPISGKAATFKLYPDLNQLGIIGEGRSVPRELWRGGNVDKEITDDIVSWLHKTLRLP